MLYVVTFIRKSDDVNSSRSICAPKHLEIISIVGFHDYYEHPGAVKAAKYINIYVYTLIGFFRTIREVVRRICINVVR